MLSNPFDRFIIKDKFEQIKRKFIYKDIGFDHPDAHISQVNINIDDITYVKKISDDETEISNLNFYKDYCPPLIIEISEKYKNAFIKTFDGNYSLLERGEEKLKRIELQKLNDISTEIKYAKHLIETLRAELIDAIDALYNFINSYKQREVKDKIPFNLSKNEVITLFHLLYQKGYIAQELDKKDISRLIGKNFEYFNKKEKKHMPILKPGKQENNLLTDHANNNPRIAIKKLKAIFTSKTFFINDIVTKVGDKK